MTFLKIFLILTGVNIFLAAMPLTIHVSYREEFSARFGYLFFHFTLAPKPPGKKEKEKPPKPQKQKSLGEKIKELYRAKGYSDFLNLFNQAAALAGGTLKSIFRHLIFSRFWLKASVAGGEAAKTAVDYGYACGAIGTATGIILCKARCENCRILVEPDFLSEESSIRFNADAHIAVFFLINAAVKALLGFLKLMKAAKPEPPKGGTARMNSNTERVLL